MATMQRSLFYSLLRNNIVTIIQLVHSMIVARLLSPNEVGLFATVAAFLAIAHSLRDFGVSSYLVQTADLSKEKLASALLILITIAWSMAVFIYVAAPVVAEFYGEEKIVQLLRLMALCFILLPFGTVNIALMKRRMAFGKLFVLGICVELVQAVVTVAAAYNGFSTFSMVMGALAAIVTTVLLAALLGKQSFKLLWSPRDIKEIAGSSMKLSASSMLKEVGTGMPEMALGKAQGFAEVGIWGKAASAINMLDKLMLSAIGGVLFPAYSELHRQGQLTWALLVRYLGNSLMIVWPLTMVLALNAEVVILVLFGEQWLAAAPVIPYICVAYLFRSAKSILLPAITAFGNFGELLRYQLIFQILMIIAVIIAAPIGLYAIGIALIVVEFIGFAMVIQSLAKSVTLSVRELLYQLVSPLFYCVILYLLHIGVKSIQQDIWLGFVLSVGAGGICWLIYVVLSGHEMGSYIKQYSINFFKRVI